MRFYFVNTKCTRFSYAINADLSRFHFFVYAAVQEERAPPVSKLQRAGTPTQLGFTPQGLSLPPPIPPVPSAFHSYDSPVSPVPAILGHNSRMFGSLPNLRIGAEHDRSFGMSPMPFTPTEFVPSPAPASATNYQLGPNVSQPMGFPGPSFPAKNPNSQITPSLLVSAESQTDVSPERITFSDQGVKLNDVLDSSRQSLLKVIEWSKRIPAFVNLSLDDQVKLLKASWCEHVLLKLSTRIGPKSDTVLLSTGITCRTDQMEDPEIRRITRQVIHEISYWLDMLNVDRVELACLKGIILFNPGECCVYKCYCLVCTMNTLLFVATLCKR